MIYFCTTNPLVHGNQELTKIDFSEIIKHLDSTNNKDIEIDTETRGYEPLVSGLLCYQLGIEDDAYVIDQESYPVELIKSYLENSEYTWLGQNIKFDLRFLLHHGIDIWKMQVYDTMLAEVILNSGLKDVGYGLDALVWRYCQYHLDKSVRGEITYSGLSQRVIKYAAEDVLFLKKIKEQQMKKLEEKDSLEVCKLEMTVTKIFAEMEYYGLKFDSEKWQEAVKFNTSEQKRLEEELDYAVETEPKLKKYIKDGYQLGLFGGAERKVQINYGSPAQIAKVIKDLGFNTPSTNAKELETINHPFVKKFIDYKKQQKLVTTYGKNFYKYVRPDNTVTTQFWQIVQTGRVSSGDKDKGYPNLQNLPAKDVFRNPFGVEDDEILVDADFSGMEAVLSAEVSGEQNWIDANNNGLDLHSINCEMVFKSKWKDSAQEGCLYYESKQKCSCKEHKKMRDKIKTTTYLYLFGGGPNKLSKQLNISKAEATKILSDFESSSPNLKNTVTLVRSFAKYHLFTRTMKPFKRRRYFENYKELPEELQSSSLAELERQSFNTLIQGSGADITKQAMIYIKEELVFRNIPHKFRLQVHDAIMLSTKKEYGEEVKTLVISCMEKAGKLVCKKANLTADAYTNKFWKK
jgi:DNA polymerase I